MDIEELRNKIQTHLAQNIVTKMKDKDDLLEALKESDELLRASYNLLNTDGIKSVDFLWEPRAFIDAKGHTNGEIVNIKVQFDEEDKPHGPYKGFVIGAASTHTNSLIDDDRITIEYGGHEDAVYVPELSRVVRAHNIVSTDGVDASPDNVADLL